MSPVGILLAAGRGTRFGADKLLHPMADGTPMAVAAGRNMAAVLERVVAVVRRDGPLAEALREARLEVVVCAAADQGMGRSLACGVAASRAASGWLIALGDMPFLAPATIAAVAAALQEGASLAAPVFADGRRGHPVGFAGAWRDALLRLTGDQGARDLLRRHAEQLRACATRDEGCVRDVDRPADLVYLPSEENVIVPSPVRSSFS